jgi:hypothetical protein
MEVKTLKEKRSLNFSVRADDESGHRLIGTPIVFNSRTTIWEGLDEIIEPTALDNTDLSDVRFLVNHDISQLPLARYVKGGDNNTMELSIDKDGVHISVDLDVENNQRAKDLYSAVQRGDVTGMSFMFDISTWNEEHEKDNVILHRVTEISKVYEVSAVTFPAYEDTTIEARSKKNISLNSDVEMLKIKCKILGGF